jgi:hypothetical protein
MDVVSDVMQHVAGRIDKPSSTGAEGHDTTRRDTLHIASP